MSIYILAEPPMRSRPLQGGLQIRNLLLFVKKGLGCFSAPKVFSFSNAFFQAFCNSAFESAFSCSFASSFSTNCIK